MKKHFLISILFLFLGPALYSQAPQSIPYQAVVRNTDGSTMANAALTITFKIHDNSATGTVVFEETHTTTTNAQGLVSLNVGGGTAVPVEKGRSPLSLSNPYNFFTFVSLFSKLT